MDYWLLVIGYWLLVIGYWLLVIGYWLLVIGYWLLVIGGSFEVGGVAVQSDDGGRDEFSAMLQQFLGDQAFIERGDQVVQNFAERASCVAAELGVLQVMKASVSFGDVCGRGSRGADQLVPEQKPLFARQGRHDLSPDKQPQFPARLPALQVLEASNRRFPFHP
jgi:hypothetical protein